MLVPDDAQSPLADFLAQLGGGHPREASLDLATRTPRRPNWSIRPGGNVAAEPKKHFRSNLEASAITSVVCHRDMAMDMGAISVDDEQRPLGPQECECISR
jgi:hypothetical protein